MSQKILVTGFDRFGRTKRPNPSSEIVLPAVEERYSELVETVVLPTARDVAAEQLREAIAALNPAAVALFGLSSGRKVRLERRAKNIKYNLLIPDNNGVRSIGRIDPEGPPRLDATLPLDAIYDRLQAALIPTRFSGHAGEFVCNEVMYHAMRQTASLEGRAIPTGFIHIGNGLQDQMVEEASALIVDELITFTQKTTDDE